MLIRDKNYIDDITVNSSTTKHVQTLFVVLVFYFSHIFENVDFRFHTFDRNISACLHSVYCFRNISCHFESRLLAVIHEYYHLSQLKSVDEGFENISVMAGCTSRCSAKRWIQLFVVNASVKTTKSNLYRYIHTYSVSQENRTAIRLIGHTSPLHNFNNYFWQRATLYNPQFIR